MKLVIVNYNAGNVKSLSFALKRLGVEPILSDNPEEILAADKVIFPGVGHAEYAMKQLKAKGLDKILPLVKNPFLGICLGQQLMCKHSEEGNTECLGLFDVEVKEFPPLEKVPHMGWNKLSNTKGPLFKGISEDAFVYHVHSYYIPVNPYMQAQCDYIVPFATSMNRDNFYACQFHPEKSGVVGEQILKNFLEL